MLGFFAFFCWTMGVLLEYRNPKTNILPFSLLESCKYDEFRFLFKKKKAKSRGVTPLGPLFDTAKILALSGEVTVQEVT